MSSSLTLNGSWKILSYSPFKAQGLDDQVSYTTNHYDGSSRDVFLKKNVIIDVQVLPAPDDKHEIKIIFKDEFFIRDEFHKA